MQHRLHAGGCQLEDRPCVVYSALFRCSVEVPIRCLNQFRPGIDAIVAAAEGPEHRLHAGRCDLKDCARVVCTTHLCCSVEISIGRLYQTCEGPKAIASTAERPKYRLHR